MRWGWDIEICWWWKNDLSYWECGLKFVEIDWIDELCELLVFDGNELIILNGWLICGKPRKKRWDWKHMLYDEMRNWAMWNCTKWMIWKRCPERENIELKKMPRKGKDWNEKKCPNGKRMWWERWKMVYLILIFLFRQFNELSVLIVIVWIDAMIGEYILRWLNMLWIVKWIDIVDWYDANMHSYLG